MIDATKDKMIHLIWAILILDVKMMLESWIIWMIHMCRETGISDQKNGHLAIIKSFSHTYQEKIRIICFLHLSKITGES